MKALGILSVLIAMLISLLLILRPGSGPDAPTAQNAPALVEKAEGARDESDLAVLRRAVQRFQAEKERLPVDLEELREQGYIEQVPAGVVYEPAMGAVSAR